MVRFRMPTTVAHISPKSDVVFLSIDKLLGGLHGIHTHQRPGSKTLSHGNTRVNGKSVREDGVCSECFISTWNVESLESGFEIFSHGESSGFHS